MQITDLLNGHTVEDVRRNNDGSVTLYCDSGRTVTLFVCNGYIELKPEKLYLPDQQTPVPELFSTRMRLSDAFQGHMIDFVYTGDAGSLVFVCTPLRRDDEPLKKSYGHREVRLTHSGGQINEMPPVSAVIRPLGLSVFGSSG